MALTGYFDADNPQHFKRISDTAILYLMEVFTPTTDFYAAFNETLTTRRPPFLLRQDVPDLHSGLGDLYEHLGDTVMACNMAEAALRVFQLAR